MSKFQIINSSFNVIQVYELKIQKIQIHARIAHKIANKILARKKKSIKPFEVK